MSKGIELESGQRFGNLVVLHLHKQYNSGKTYLCQCDCGNLVTYGASYLYHGRVLSCGCGIGRKKGKDRSNMIGKRFGKLVIIDTLYESGASYFICRCDCGNEFKVIAGSVLNGLTVSCGCYSHSVEQSLDRLNNSKATKRNRYSSNKGVCYIVKDNIWRAEICFNYISYALGKYKCEEDAVNARKRAEQQVKDYGKVLDYVSKRSVKKEG